MVYKEMNIYSHSKKTYPYNTWAITKRRRMIAKIAWVLDETLKKGGNLF